MQKIGEFHTLYKEITAGIALVKQAHAAFQSIKKGDRGMPGTKGDRGPQGVSGPPVTREEIEAAVHRHLVQPKDGMSPEPMTVAEHILAHPSFEKILKKHLKPGKDGQSPATDALVSQVMEQLKGKKVSIADIDGIEQRFAELRNHISASKEWRGGGDTVVAGTGVTITDTVNGNKRISASGGVGAWQTPVESPNGVITTFTVGGSAPTDVVADGASFYQGAGYSYAAGQITFDNPPAQYVRYR